MAVKTLHTKEQILKLLEENREQIKEFGVSKLGLFGSYAKGEQIEDSDINFIVEFNEGMKSYQSLLDLTDFLEHVFQHKVDVVTKQAIASWLKPYIDEYIIYVEFNN